MLLIREILITIVDASSVALLWLAIFVIAGILTGTF